MGLVNAVVSHKELLPAARMLLERILVHSPLAARRYHYPHRGHAGH
ncbi:hypothetical protein [Azospirillum formosense]|nr:hypothetical protein [Azospirillum formosense]